MSKYTDWLQSIAAETEAENKRKSEAGKKNQFNLGSLLPALIAAPFTGGGSLAGTLGAFATQALPTAIGEGYRAATGSDTDYGSLLSGVSKLYRPSIDDLGKDSMSSAVSSPTDLATAGASRARHLGSLPKMDALGKTIPAPAYAGVTSALDQASRVAPKAPDFWSEMVAGGKRSFYTPEEIKTTEKINELKKSGKFEPSSYTDKTTGISYKAPEKEKALSLAERILLKQAVPGKNTTPTTGSNKVDPDVVVELYTDAMTGIAKGKSVADAIARISASSQYDARVKQAVISRLKAVGTGREI